MGFLRRLFGGQPRPAKDSGIYLYFRSKRAADAVTKIRIEPKYDLNAESNGYVWHKTIVDSRYFSKINAIVYFDSNHNLTTSDVDGGELISAEAYEAALAERNKPAEPDEPEEPAGGDDDGDDAEEPAG